MQINVKGACIRVIQVIHYIKSNLQDLSIDSRPHIWCTSFAFQKSSTLVHMALAQMKLKDISLPLDNLCMQLGFQGSTDHLCMGY